MTWPNWIWDGRLFLGIEWHVWKVIGWAGNVIFFSRFFVQWIATEKQKRVVVPISFWWLSLIGSGFGDPDSTGTRSRSRSAKLKRST